MTLREQQSLFVRLVGRLIEWAYVHDYDLTFGETVRTPEQALQNATQGIGSAHSLHCERLAIDLNLFLRCGKYLGDTEAYRPLGEWWEGLHPLCRWGGRFSRPDGNHFSLEWQGRQ